MDHLQPLEEGAVVRALRHQAQEQDHLPPQRPRLHPGIYQVRYLISKLIRFDVKSNVIVFSQGLHRAQAARPAVPWHPAPAHPADQHRPDRADGEQPQEGEEHRGEERRIALGKGKTAMRNFPLALQSI